MDDLLSYIKNLPRPAQAACLALAAMTLMVFSRTLTHDFVNFDDDKYVYENPVVAQGVTLHGLDWAFKGGHADNWHPLTWISHMLDCQVYGLHPGGHHLTNIILHTATVVALFLVLQGLTGAFWRSVFVAAVFAIHPLRVESVAWVSERKDVLSGLFFVLTIGAYARYARQPQSTARYGWVMGLFALGLMSKPMLATLPLVLLALDYWPLRRTESPRQLLMEKLPLLALSAASCVATIRAQHGAIQSIAAYPLALRLANATVACVVYLRQMFYPSGLVIFYPYPHHGLPSWQVAGAAALLAGISAIAWWQRRQQPWLLAGWAWYLIMLLPVAGIIQVGAQAHADRYTYLPQIGIYMAIAWLAAKWLTHRLAAGTVMAGVVAVLTVCTWRQIGYWKNSQTLWTRALACTTGNDMAHLDLGNDLLRRGKVDDAIAEFHETLKIHPDYAEAYHDLSLCFRDKRQLDDAIANDRKALEIVPDYADAHYNLGYLFQAQNRIEEAVAEYEKAVKLKPDSEQIHLNLGAALCQNGKTAEAESEENEALRLRPGYERAHFNLGLIFLQEGKTEQAIAEFKACLLLKPDHLQAQQLLDEALRKSGK